MSLVFVSHAKDDKPVLRPVVDALLHQNFRVFIDDPQGLTPFYSDAEVEEFGIERLVGSHGSWRGQLNYWLKEADIVLACWSNRLAHDRTILVNELVYANTAGKLIACALDETDYSKLPSDLGLLRPTDQQAPRIDTKRLKAALDRVVVGRKPSGRVAQEWERFKSFARDMRSLAANRSVAVDPTQTAQKLARAEASIAPKTLAPILYRTPRLTQSNKVIDQLDHVQCGEMRALIVAGPSNEVVTGFVSGIPDTWASARPGPPPVLLPPILFSGDLDPQDVESHLRNQLARQLKSALEPSRDISDLRIYAAAMRKRFPDQVVVCATPPIDIEEALASKQVIVEWFRFWGRIRDAATEPKPKIAPVLTIEMDAATPPWGPKRWPTSANASLIFGCANKRLFKRCQELAAQSQKTSDWVDATFLPLLSPVQYREADPHLEQALPKEVGYEGKREGLRQLFETNGAMRHGLTMADFFKGATACLRG